MVGRRDGAVWSRRRSSCCATDGARVRAVDPKAAEALRRAGRAVRAADRRRSSRTPTWIVLSPGVPADLEPLEAARRRGVQVIGEVELAAPFLKGKIIGITGSNGKTTTTALTGHILRECGIAVQVGGNIGTPVDGDGRDFAAGSMERAGTLQLSAGDHRALSRRYRGLPERDAESSGPASHFRELRGRQGRACSRRSSRTISRC